MILQDAENIITNHSYSLRRKRERRFIYKKKKKKEKHELLNNISLLLFIYQLLPRVAIRNFLLFQKKYEIFCFLVFVFWPENVSTKVLAFTPSQCLIAHMSVETVVWCGCARTCQFLIATIQRACYLSFLLLLFFFSHSNSKSPLPPNQKKGIHLSCFAHGTAQLVFGLFKNPMLLLSPLYCLPLTLSARGSPSLI